MPMTLRRLLSAVLLSGAVLAAPRVPTAGADATGPGSLPMPESLLIPGSLLMPVIGVDPALLRDQFGDVRGLQRHEAIDIMAPRGSAVVAVADGRVAKLFTSKPGGLTVYQFDASGQVAYYYAHLDRYADGLREGTPLRRGDAIGAVGNSGNAAGGATHLHFAVFLLGPGREWWLGTAVNPYPLLVAPLPSR